MAPMPTSPIFCSCTNCAMTASSIGRAFPSISKTSWPGGVRVCRRNIQRCGIKFRVTPLSGLYSKILIASSPIAACCTRGTWWNISRNLDLNLRLVHRKLSSTVETMNSHESQVPAEITRFRRHLAGNEILGTYGTLASLQAKRRTWQLVRANAPMFRPLVESMTPGHDGYTASLVPTNWTGHEEIRFRVRGRDLLPSGLGVLICKLGPESGAFLPFGSDFSINGTPLLAFSSIVF